MPSAPAAGVSESWLVRDVGRITRRSRQIFCALSPAIPSWSTSSRLSATFVRPVVAGCRFQAGNGELDAGGARPALCAAGLHAVSEGFQRPDRHVLLQCAGQPRRRAQQLPEPAGFAKKRRTHPRAGRGRAGGRDGSGPSGTAGIDGGKLVDQCRSQLQQSLDNFKIQLGLPVDANIVLDDAGTGGVED